MRYYKRLLIIISFLFISSIQAQTTYFVDATDGNDLNDGTTQLTAWQTLDKVIAMCPNFNPGDSILLKKGEIWNDQVLKTAIHPSGTIDHPITYGAYGEGANPIINMHIDQSSIWSDEGSNIWSTVLVWTCGTRYFKNDIEMLQADELANLGLYGTKCYIETIDDSSEKLYLYSTTDPALDSFKWSNACKPIQLSGTDYINLVDLDLQGGSFSLRLVDNEGWNIENCSIGKNSDYGIFSTNTSNITIKGTIFDSNFTVDMSELPEGTPSYFGNSDGILILEGCSNISIHHCYFKNWGHASFGANTEDSSKVITNISFFNNELTSPDILYGGRIGYSGYAENGEYYNNYLHNISITNQLGGSNNHFHHNIIDTLHNSPLSVGVICAGVLIENYNIQIKNNIIENNLIANVEGKGIELYSINFDYPGMLTGNIVRNNIVYNCGTLIDDIAIEFNKDSSENIYDNMIENNLFYSDNTTETCLYQYGGDIYDVATFNTLNTDLFNNIDGNPLFVDPENGDYHLLPDSPAINAGAPALSTLDYDGNIIPNGGATDIGVYEYYEDVKIEVNSINNTLFIFPNPTKNSVYFSMDLSNKKYKIISTTGSIIKSGIINGNEISFEDLKPGLYFIEILDSNKKTPIIKLIKE